MSTESNFKSTHYPQGPKGDKGDTGATGAAGAVVNLDKYNASLAAIAALQLPHVDPGKLGAIWVGGAATDQTGAVSLNGALRFNDRFQAGVGVSSDTNARTFVVKGGGGFQF
jgi:hypothetical protein